MQTRFTTFMAVFAAALLACPLLIISADRPQTAADSMVQLPAPRTSGGMSLVEALAKRRSQRAFDARALTSEQIAQLCWAAQGITDQEGGFRTAPSALKLFAITVFVVDQQEAYEYVPASHALRRLDRADAAAHLRAAISERLRGAPVLMVLAMEPERLKERCGDRAERFSLLEAGHVAQNILLQATAMGLVSVPAGGIDEARTAAALGLGEGLRPVYVLPVGHPAEHK